MHPFGSMFFHFVQFGGKWPNKMRNPGWGKDVNSLIFSGGSRISQRGHQPHRGHQPIICPIFPENCVRIKKFWAFLAPPRSAHYFAFLWVMGWGWRSDTQPRSDDAHIFNTFTHFVYQTLVKDGLLQFSMLTKLNSLNKTRLSSVTTGVTELTGKPPKAHPPYSSLTPRTTTWLSLQRRVTVGDHQIMVTLHLLGDLNWCS